MTPAKATADQLVIVPAALTASGIQNDGVPTQVANPKRTSWRTFVQSAIPWLLGINVAVPIVYAFLISPDVAPSLETLLGPVYAWLVIGFNAAAVVLSLGAKLLAQIMAQPAVNALISNTPWLSWLAPIKPAGE